MVSKQRCNLSPKAIEVIVCLQDWNLANKRLHDYVREEVTSDRYRELKIIKT